MLAQPGRPAPDHQGAGDPNEWPAAQTAILRELWEAGAYPAAIAARVNAIPGAPRRTPGAVASKAKRLRLSARRIPTPDAPSPRRAVAQHRQPIALACLPDLPGAPDPQPAPAWRVAGQPRPRTCQFCMPSGEDFPRWTYCGAPTVPGRRAPYCSDHHQACIREAPEA